MTYRRAFKLGDRVKIGETIGDVIEMRLQVTHLRSLKNEEVIVPKLTDLEQRDRELQLVGERAQLVNFRAAGRTSYPKRGK
jgi:mechanosensitive ion channel-like protein